MAAFYVDPPRAPYWPSQHWHTSTPEEQGMDSAMLAGALEFARATDLPLHSVTVIRDGLLVLDAFLGFVRDMCICHAWHIHISRTNPKKASRTRRPSRMTVTLCSGRSVARANSSAPASMAESIPCSSGVEVCQCWLGQ